MTLLVFKVTYIFTHMGAMCETNVSAFKVANIRLQIEREIA